MPTKNGETDPGPDDSVSTPNGPGEGPMSPAWIVAVALYLVFVSALVLYGLIKLWPYPTPSGETSSNTESQATTAAPTTTPAAGGTSPQTGSTTPPTQTPATSNGAGGSVVGGANAGASAGGAAPQAAPGQAAPAQAASTKTSPTPASTPGERKLPDPEKISFFGGRLQADIYLETRLLLLVMLAGALGSLMHSLRSLYWYTGNRMMVWSWVGFYLLLPLTGAILAVIFYFVVRGGFFSPQASFENTSPFGFAALSALVGLFSPQATLKLKEIAETIFTKPAAGADTKVQESGSKTSVTTPAVAPTVSSVSPGSGSTGGATTVLITGSGFVQGAAVKFGGLPATVTAVSDTTIEVITPASTGQVDVEVTNPDGQTAKLVQSFAYVAPDSVADGSAVDELDGHDADIKPDTTDEDLPITEGGVE